MDNRQTRILLRSQRHFFSKLFLDCFCLNRISPLSPNNNSLFRQGSMPQAIQKIGLLQLIFCFNYCTDMSSWNINKCRVVTIKVSSLERTFNGKQRINFYSSSFLSLCTSFFFRINRHIHFPIQFRSFFSLPPPFFTLTLLVFLHQIFTVEKSKLYVLNKFKF